MLEIVILVVLAGKIGKIVEKKGRKKAGYQLMLVGMWFAGEIFGGLMGGIIGTFASESENGPMLFGALLGLGCAILAAIVAFQIAKNLEPIGEGEEEFYRDVEYADDLGARERFRDRSAAPPPTDAYTDKPEKGRRPADDRIQE